MMSNSRIFFQTISHALNALENAIHKAVPAVNHKRQMPRWRNLGKSITPYHFLTPIPVQVQQRKK